LDWILSGYLVGFGGFLLVPTMLPLLLSLLNARGHTVVWPYWASLGITVGWVLFAAWGLVEMASFSPKNLIAALLVGSLMFLHIRLLLVRHRTR